MQVMATMRAMRRLKPDPIPREVLEDVVRAATWAPSGSDAQHYAFVVVTDRQRMAELAELWRDVVDTYSALMGTVVPDTDDERHSRMADALRYQAEHFHDTPALVAVCYRKTDLGMSTLLDVRSNVALARRLGATRLRKLAAGARAAGGIGEASSIYPAAQNLLLAPGPTASAPPSRSGISSARPTSAGSSAYRRTTASTPWCRWAIPSAGSAPSAADPSTRCSTGSSGERGDRSVSGRDGERREPADHERGVIRRLCGEL
jgi:nitroreductase